MKIALLCTKIFTFCSRKSAEPQVDTFNSAVNTFKTAKVDFTTIQEPLEVLEKAFTQKVKLNHPRKIYPLYEALTAISIDVANCSEASIKSSWGEVLNSLHQRRIYRIGLGETSFDTTIAQKVLKGNLNQIQSSIIASPIDVKIKKNHDEVVDYIYQMDREAFGVCFTKGFLDAIIKSNDIRCFVARDEDNKIVGILWGFLATHQNQQLFHFWELSRKASMAKMGIAKALMDCAKQQQRLYPDLKFATLNVNADNQHAKEIYDNEKFTLLNEEEKDAAKIFMKNQLSDNPSVTLSPDAAKTVVRNFVMKTVPLPKLIMHELLRRCDLCFRALRYR
jgi:ribosomal protein S18 acetylase RimI-like enzyme